MYVIGRIPNIELLKKYHLSSMKICFVLLTFGLASGTGMAIVKSSVLDMRFIDWVTDPKIILIIAAWGFLGAVLSMRPIFGFKDTIVAYTTIVVFSLILLAIAGVAVFSGTKHDFAGNAVTVSELEK